MWADDEIGPLTLVIPVYEWGVRDVFARHLPIYAIF